MGGDSSKIVREHELTSQPRFPRVIDTRFVHERMVSLRLQDRFWSHGNRQALEILDAQNNRVLFKIPPQSSAGRRQQLLDTNSVPIVVMDEFIVGHDYATFIPTVPVRNALDSEKKWDPKTALCYFDTSMRPMEWRLHLELDDPQTKKKLQIQVEGDWREHRALFFIDRSDSYKRNAVARAYISPEDKKKNKANKKGGADVYQVDVAPGVDVAMIVLACAALDEALARKRSGKQVDLPNDPTTLALAKRHRGVVGDQINPEVATGVAAFF